ncbi:hypothetical protein ITJ86_05085 [Winogradskyella sp. F6397]|uniref:DUF4268 domain-containing protein n=1 Tax=Winogradskyella marina TaxID=2785530 RepID=A0ABS0EFM6_9FLAO|nr:hypothetical protein [Winogradskyella marina]MBF8149258.1 hypothetical protein [Winogradskyella marina]
MTKKDWLLEQLKISYPKSKTTEKGTFIYLLDTPYKGISISINDGLYVDLKHFDLVEFSSLAIYLESRIKTEDIRLYHKTSNKSISFYFYKKFSEGSKGEFEKAMWTFKVIEKLVDNIKHVVDRIVMQ